MTAREKMEKIVNILYNKKAVDIEVLELSEITLIADYFVVCSGNSSTQIKALSDEVDEQLSKENIQPYSREGYQSANWILLDYNDVIVHVFHQESRNFYALERLWADAKHINVEEIVGENEKAK